jgi:hypothetical protein
MKKSIDDKILDLINLTSNFLFIEYYSHENCEMYKILNEFTNFNKDKLVLCKVSDGIELAIDLAIEQIKKRKLEFIWQTDKCPFCESEDLFSVELRHTKCRNCDEQWTN